MSVERNYKPGDELVPGYRLVQFLGRGGFGQVWKAAAPGGTLCALKMILLKDKMAFKEFRAIRLVKLIRHPNLTPILALWLKDDNGNLISENADLDSLDAKGGKDFELIVAMGLGDKNLLDRLEECRDQGLGGIPIDELLNYMEASAKAVDFLNKPTATPPGGSSPGDAHKAIQHCDIKPQNILIVGGEAQVCDFGLARSADDVRKTSSGAASYCYVAPELISNMTTKATDQYSLAISYYELRTGQLPFHAQSLPQVIQVHLQGTLDFGLIPAEEQKALKRATAVKGEDRWPTCIEMVRALRRAIEGGSSSEGSRSSSQSGWKPTTGPLQPGTELVPDHKLVKYLGRGSYGEVWEATTGAGGAMKVALKVIGGLQRQQGQQEFRALELVCQEEIAHHHLLEVKNFWLLDAGNMPIRDEIRNKPGAPTATTLVISMRLAVKSLLQRLKEFQAKPGHVGGMPIDELLPYMRQAAEAIDYLNTPQMRDGREISIQHRDIKPENILLDRNNQVKVADFGLAKVLEGSKAAITGDSMGFTPNYAAPEYFRNEVTPWSDQYSLAVTYYHLRAGRLPFQSGTSAEVMRVHQEGRLDFSGLLPKEQDVLKAATALNPEDRYPSCLDMVSALEEACGYIAPEGPRSKVTRTTSRPQPGPSGQWGQPIDPYRQTAQGPGYPASQHDFRGMQTGQIPPMYSMHTQEAPRPGSYPGMPDMGGIPSDTAVNPAALTQRPRSDPDFLAHVQQPDPRITGSNPNLGLMQTSPLPSSHPSMHNFGPQGFAQPPYQGGPQSMYGMQGPPSMYNYGPPPKSKKMIWIGGVVLLLVIGGAFGAWKFGGFGGGKTGTEPPEKSPTDSVAQIQKQLDEINGDLAKREQFSANQRVEDLNQLLRKSELADPKNTELRISTFLALLNAYDILDDKKIKIPMDELTKLKANVPAAKADLLASIDEAIKRAGKKIKGGFEPAVLVTSGEEAALVAKCEKLLKEGVAKLEPKDSTGTGDPRGAANKFREMVQEASQIKNPKDQQSVKEDGLIWLARAEWLANNVPGVQQALNGIGQPSDRNKTAVDALGTLVALKGVGMGEPQLRELKKLGKGDQLTDATYKQPELGALKRFADEAKKAVLKVAIREENLTKASDLTEKVIDFDAKDRLALKHQDVLKKIHDAETPGGTDNLLALLADPEVVPRRGQIGSLLLKPAIKEQDRYKDLVRAKLVEALPLVRDKADLEDDYRALLGERIELDLRTGVSPKELVKSTNDMTEALRFPNASLWVKAALAEERLAEKTGWGEAQSLLKQLEGGLPDGASFLNYLQARLRAHESAGIERDLKKAAASVIAAYAEPSKEVQETSRELLAADILTKAAAENRDSTKKEYFEPRYYPGKADDAARWLGKSKELLKAANTEVPESMELNLALGIAEGSTTDQKQASEDAQKLLAKSAAQLDPDGYRLLFAFATKQGAKEAGLALTSYLRLADLINWKLAKKGDKTATRLYKEVVLPATKMESSIPKGGQAQKALAKLTFLQARLLRLLPKDESLKELGIDEPLKLAQEAISKAIALDTDNKDLYAERGLVLVATKPRAPEILSAIEQDADKLDKNDPRMSKLKFYCIYTRARNTPDNQLEEKIKLFETAEKTITDAVRLAKADKRFEQDVSSYLLDHATVCLTLGNFRKEEKQKYLNTCAQDVQEARTLDAEIETRNISSIVSKSLEDLKDYNRALALIQQAIDDSPPDDELGILLRDRGRCAYKEITSQVKPLDQPKLGRVIADFEKSVSLLTKEIEKPTVGSALSREKKLQAFAESNQYLAKSYELKRPPEPAKAIKSLLDAFDKEESKELREDYLAEGSRIALEMKNSALFKEVANKASQLTGIDPAIKAVIDGRLLQMEDKSKEAVESYKSALPPDTKKANLRFVNLYLAYAQLLTDNAELWYQQSAADAADALQALENAAFMCDILERNDLGDSKLFASVLAQEALIYAKLLNKAGIDEKKAEKDKIYVNCETKFEEALKKSPNHREAPKWRTSYARVLVSWSKEDGAEFTFKEKLVRKATAKRLIDEVLENASDKEKPALNKLKASIETN